MSTAIVPSDGLTGIYRLTADLDPYYNKKTPYTCKSIRRIEDIINADEDPLEDYYQPLGYDQIRLEADLLAGAAIVGLVTVDNKWLYVPSTSITAMPDQSGIRYTPVALGVVLGAINDTYDLTGLRTAISNTVRKYLATTPTITTLVVGVTEMLSLENHMSVERARALSLATGDTDDIRIRDLERINRELSTKLAALEQFIVDNQ